MVANFDNVSFVGYNIPNELEQVMSSANMKIDASFDNDDQRKAYYLGVQNTVSILRQMLDCDLEANCIVFYYPSADTGKQMSAKELAEYINNL